MPFAVKTKAHPLQKNLNLLNVLRVDVKTVKDDKNNENFVVNID